jgi:hypothetical protein
VIVIRAKVRPTRTTKHFKEGVVRRFIEKTLKRGVHVDSATGKPINQETGCRECIIPIV